MKVMFQPKYFQTKQAWELVWQKTWYVIFCLLCRWSSGSLKILKIVHNLTNIDINLGFITAVLQLNKIGWKEPLDIFKGTLKGKLNL
jgi:hypothetical protein